MASNNPYYLMGGEADDFTLNFGRRMGSATGVGYGFYVPANISAFSHARTGSAITIRLGSATGGWVYAISGYIDLSDGRRLFDTMHIHAG